MVGGDFRCTLLWEKSQIYHSIEKEKKDARETFALVNQIPSSYNMHVFFFRRVFMSYYQC